MLYRLLGELEVGPEGRLVKLPAGPTLILLAVLLLNANTRMSKSDLIRVAWGKDDVKEAQLHKRVNELRKLLSQIGKSSQLETHARYGYELHATAQDLDSLLFSQLVRKAEESKNAGRADQEVSSLRSALRLWRGPHPVSNVPDETFIQEVIALEQRRKRVAVRLFDLELARGGHEQVLDDLVLMAGLYPADRRLCEQLMIAEYRGGHLTEVNDAYEHYREAVEDETGGDPDPLLRNLHFAIARGDEEAIAQAESAIAERTGTPARPVMLVPRQLPAPADLVGRDNLVAEIPWLLRREPRPTVPVVVISGPGGIGKSALAARAAHESLDRFPDGQLYLELHGTSGSQVDTSEALAQFLRALGLPRVPESKSERLGLYRTVLADRRLLIVLDDAADGEQVTDLMPSGPGSAMLVTARQRMPDVPGAHHVAALEPLGADDAAELFRRIVTSAGIALDSDQDAVGQIVELCGGLPLALRVAAALRVHDHPRSTADLAKRLAGTGPEGFEYGRLSVARTIGTGFDRLDDAARELFLGLGLLPLTTFGSWTAAALLGRSDGGADAALSQLAGSFMIQGQAPDQRYKFHDLTRDYARRLARKQYPGDPASVPVAAYRSLLTLIRRGHASLYGGAFEVVHSALPDADLPAEVLAEVDAAPFDWFELERRNIGIAVGHSAELGLTDLSWDLAVSAHEFYAIGGYFDDWRATHAVALAACRQAGDERGEGVLLTFLNQPILLASGHADSRESIAELEQAAGKLAACGDRNGLAITLRTLANAWRRQGHLTRPLALFNEAITHYSVSGDLVGQSQTLRFIGQVFLDLGDFADALRFLKRAEELALRLSGGRLVAQTSYWIGQVCLAADDLGGAREAFNAVFETFRDDANVGHAYAVHGLGQLALREKQTGAAERHLGVAIDLAHGTDAGLEGRANLAMAELFSMLGEVDQQVSALRQAIAGFVGYGAAYLEVRALAALGEALTSQGDEAGADACWDRVEEIYHLAGVPEADRLHHRPGR